MAMENTNNKVKAAIVGLGAVAVILSLAPLPIWKLPVVANAIWLVKVITLIIILRDGSITDAKPYNILMLLCLTVVLVGAMFKIMHWPGANMMLILSLSGLMVIYAARYAFKPRKDLLDNLKVIFFCSWILAALNHIMHWPGADVLQLLASSSFIGMAAVVIKKFMQQPDTDAGF